MENSIAKITIPESGECGTCYFLNKSIVATCFHVIESVFKSADNTITPGSCEIEFYETYIDANEEKRIRVGNTTVKQLLGVDKINDIAILELEKEMSGAEPVSLLRHTTIPANADWYSRGFPAINQNGIPLNGKVQSLVTFDINKQERMELKAEQVEKNQLGGISGSPVFVNGKVVGHLTSNAVDKEENNIFGLVYAVSGGYIRRLADNFVAGLNDDLGMVIFKDGEIYVKRGIEGLISDNLLKGGVCLTGYMMSGKTRTISYFKEFERDGIFLDVAPQKIRSAKVELYNLETKIIDSNLESLLKFFCDTIVREINTTEENFSPPDWNQPGTQIGIASEWFKETLLSYFKKNEIRFFIYIDNGEVIFDKFEQQVCVDFFSMLRGWTSEKEGSGVFGILMSFTDAFFLKDLKRPAIFNAIISLELKDFNAKEIQTFAGKYCLEHKISEGGLKKEQIADIIKWTGGNPCLVRLLFQGILQEKVRNRDEFDFDAAFNKIVRDRSWFKHYLDTLEDSLESDLTKEINLYKVDYTYLDEKKSNAEARRKLVKSGILLEQLSDHGKQYKLRCAHFSF